ncbi:hypothetical protein CJ030_MR6G020500 [Morella rubra]|uniref:Uncharacterized protein n=1 Tax=Morella rubra TaxID=262757 RepID=A0A6A1V9Z0_9ROSI|nr:hypothetical protein CJ030_MR6G020500 [Morella rubra]
MSCFSKQCVYTSQDVVIAAGGKRLCCDSSARSVGASDQTGTRAVMTPVNAAATTSNGADEDLPSLHRSTARHPQSSCASTSGIRHVRGRTHGLALEKAHIAGKLSVIFSMADDFNLDYDRPEDRNTVMSTMNTAYRTHRNRMHQYYALFPTKEVLEHPYPNMKKEEWPLSVNYLVLNNSR